LCNKESGLDADSHGRGSKHIFSSPNLDVEKRWEEKKAKKYDWQMSAKKKEKEKKKKKKQINRCFHAKKVGKFV
jgi:hypothetical protein